MDNLNIIQYINPNWHSQIITFLKEHAEFYKLLPIVAFDEFPPGFNRNPNECEINPPQNIFETLVYGISHANSSSLTEGKEQCVAMLAYLRSINAYTETDITFPETVLSNNAVICKKMVTALIDNDIIINDMSLDDLSVVEQVEGVPKNTIALVYMLYAETNDERVIPYRDSYFTSGMEMLYGWTHESSTKEQIKEKTDTWDNKKVGVMFIIQYAYHYSHIKI